MKKQSLVLTNEARHAGSMTTSNSFSHHDHFACADRDSARVSADLRALGAPEYAERAPGLLDRLLRRSSQRRR